MSDNARYSYYFPPYRESVLNMNPDVVAKLGFIGQPNHYVNVDLLRQENGDVVAKISVNLPSGNSVSSDALPVIVLTDGTEYHFEPLEEGSFTEITLSAGEVNQLDLKLDGISLGHIVIDDTPLQAGVAVRFEFHIGTPERK